MVKVAYRGLVFFCGKWIVFGVGRFHPGLSRRWRATGEIGGDPRVDGPAST